jgi:RimJ/RimL family protein N-acetyltransferase
VKKVLFNDQRVTNFVKQRCGVTNWTTPVSIGVEEGGEIIGGFVATDCQPGLDIMCNIAGEPGRYWGTRRFFQVCFFYLFKQLGLRRVTALVEADNTASRTLVCKLGFQVEGVLRERGKDGGNMVIYGMLRKECRWLPDALGSSAGEI